MDCGSSWNIGSLGGVVVIDVPMVAVAEQKIKFSKTQWKKPRDGQRNCINCIGKIASMGPMGRVLKNSHSLSTGIVDGRQHLVDGNIRWDRAIRASSSDRDVADKLLAEFNASFDITKVTVTSMKKHGKNEESYMRFQLMQNVEDHGPIGENSMTDFLTTVRTQSAHHLPFQHLPEQSGSWPINTTTGQTHCEEGNTNSLSSKYYYFNAGYLQERILAQDAPLPPFSFDDPDLLEKT